MVAEKVVTELVVEVAVILNTSSMSELPVMKAMVVLGEILRLGVASREGVVLWVRWVSEASVLKSAVMLNEVLSCSLLDAMAIDSLSSRIWLFDIEDAGDERPDPVSEVEVVRDGNESPSPLLVGKGARVVLSSALALSVREIPVIETECVLSKTVSETSVVNDWSATAL